MEVAAKSQIWKVNILTGCYEIPGYNYSLFFISRWVCGTSNEGGSIGCVYGVG